MESYRYEIMYLEEEDHEDEYSLEEEDDIDWWGGADIFIR